MENITNKQNTEALLRLYRSGITTTDKSLEARLDREVERGNATVKRKWLIGQKTYKLTDRGYAKAEGAYARAERPEYGEPVSDLLDALGDYLQQEMSTARPPGSTLGLHDSTVYGSDTPSAPHYTPSSNDGGFFSNLFSSDSPSSSYSSHGHMTTDSIPSHSHDSGYSSHDSGHSSSHCSSHSCSSGSSSSCSSGSSCGGGGGGGCGGGGD